MAAPRSGARYVSSPASPNRSGLARRLSRQPPFLSIDRDTVEEDSVMVRMVRRPWAAMMLGCLLGPTGTATAADRPAPEILGDLSAIKMPAIDPARQAEPGYRQSFQRQLIDAAARRDALILELFRADPNNQYLPPLMQERWRRNPPTDANDDRLDREIAAVLSRSRNDALRAEATFARAQISLLKSRQTGKFDMTAIEQFLTSYPRDQRGALLLYMGTFVATDAKTKTSLQDRILRDYPDSQVVGDIKASRRQTDSIGKPFELTFTDAITGSKVSMKALRGKVVVLDFWATWCAPCVSEMPHMKELYAKYHDRGVEFIGVSLDKPKEEGGLDSLKDFVKQNRIPWPQFYDGQPAAREFTLSWGVNLLPTVFVVDAEGNLASVQAHGKLDEIIPELLAKKGQTVPGRPASGG